MSVDWALVGPQIRALYREHADQLVWVYAIQAGAQDGPVKIGITVCPAERLTTLQQGNAEQLRGIAAFRCFPHMEKLLHDEFAFARIRGEWFRPVDELIDVVMRLGGDFCDWDLAQLKRDLAQPERLAL